MAQLKMELLSRCARQSQAGVLPLGGSSCVLWISDRPVLKVNVRLQVLIITHIQRLIQAHFTSMDTLCGCNGKPAVLLDVNGSRA